MKSRWPTYRNFSGRDRCRSAGWSSSFESIIIWNICRTTRKNLERIIQTIAYIQTDRRYTIWTKSQCRKERHTVRGNEITSFCVLVRIDKTLGTIRIKKKQLVVSLCCWGSSIDFCIRYSSLCTGNKMLHCCIHMY